MSQTDLIAVGLAVLVLLVSLVTWRSWRAAGRAVNEAEAAVFRLEAVAAERQLVIARAERIGKTIDAGTAAVALGNDVVKTTHNVIAASVFGILDSIPSTKEGSAEVRVVHDATADTVYTAINEVNKAIGGVLKGFTNPSTRGPAAGKPPEPGSAD